MGAGSQRASNGPADEKKFHEYHQEPAMQYRDLPWAKDGSEGKRPLRYPGQLTMQDVALRLTQRAARDGVHNVCRDPEQRSLLVAPVVNQKCGVKATMGRNPRMKEVRGTVNIREAAESSCRQCCRAAGHLKQESPSVALRKEVGRRLMALVRRGGNSVSASPLATRPQWTHGSGMIRAEVERR